MLCCTNSAQFFCPCAFSVRACAVVLYEVERPRHVERIVLVKLLMSKEKRRAAEEAERLRREEEAVCDPVFSDLPLRRLFLQLALKLPRTETFAPECGGKSCATSCPKPCLGCVGCVRLERKAKEEQQAAEAERLRKQQASPRCATEISDSALAINV
eukprot:1115478-Amphidinium_carterae.1